MKVTVYARNIELTDGLKDAVERKILKLEKYFAPEVEAKATLKVDKNKHIIEVMIPFNGVYLRGEEATDDMYKSIDLVENKLERQIRKQKTKLEKRKNYDSLRFAHIASLTEEEIEPEIVKTKRFDIKPMMAEEAVLQMELIGHNFFVFQDAETNQLNVVYKRKDGHYGLIEPEFE
ncbi:ribosome hibernation-promoting factor, HPF/YfiA family [Clostridium tarantellae]|uniref:Ribosome hibernation promoting factor n=1 Tax=Clostridium tarantellae TaxID=39493 RepID=A0A6I1MN79_9CLOT|nr:ribosome-associated translation inhibitor RaiA [Clostridium tarantellae]MPQ43567.1 ribosome-associated translation inhibitor RaiA [Clostridium tarantellae]